MRSRSIAPYRAYFEFHDPSVLGQHVERVVALVAGEGPVHEKAVATRLSRAYGLQRAGSRIALAVTTAISMAERQRKVRRRGAFVWPVQGDISQVRVPVPGQDETMRLIDTIPPEEVELALMRMVETAGSIDPGTLRTTVARIFGFERTGGRIDQALEVRLSALLANKRLSLAAGMVMLGPKAKLPTIARDDLDGRVPGRDLGAPSSPRRRTRPPTQGSVVTIDFQRGGEADRDEAGPAREGAASAMSSFGARFAASGRVA